MNEKGMQTEDAGPFAGMFMKIQTYYRALEESGHLLKDTRLCTNITLVMQSRIFRATGSGLFQLTHSETMRLRQSRE